MSAMINHVDRRPCNALASALSQPPAKARMSVLCRCFTLVELLVVMGVIAVLGILTTLSYRGIAQDAKLASGKNTVAAVLDNARGLAMKNNRVVIVVFRPRLDGREQYVEAVLGISAGTLVYDTGGANPLKMIDRFEAIPGVATRALARGVKVAGPDYGSDEDFAWLTQAHLPAINQTTGAGEAAGSMLGVMYAPDGTVITRDPSKQVARLFFDFDADGVQELSGAAVAANSLNYFDQKLESDEPFIDPMPFIAVFDDDEVRELYDVSQWTVFDDRVQDYSEYITNNVTAMHFNRYSGVVMK